MVDAVTSSMASSPDWNEGSSRAEELEVMRKEEEAQKGLCLRIISSFNQFAIWLMAFTGRQMDYGGENLDGFKRGKSNQWNVEISICIYIPNRTPTTKSQKLKIKKGGVSGQGGYHF